jgi:nucleotide-binding universal stress UspA family protein
VSKVIAAVDDSPEALAVITTGDAVASLFGSTLELAHVCEGKRDALPARLSSSGHEVRLLRGPVSSTIAQAAAEADVAAVVLGAGSSRAGTIVGSCAQQLITSVRIPVVVVPVRARAPARIRRILIPLDGTRAASDALRHAVELSAQPDVHFIALHVHTQTLVPMFSDQPHHEVRAWSAEFLRRQELPISAPSRLRLRLGVGQAGDEVLSVAAQEGVDLIVLGWRQDLSAGRAAVVRSTILRATVPVLLIPTQRGARAQTPAAHAHGRAARAGPQSADRSASGSLPPRRAGGRALSGYGRAH